MLIALSARQRRIFRVFSALPLAAQNAHQSYPHYIYFQSLRLPYQHILHTLCSTYVCVWSIPESIKNTHMMALPYIYSRLQKAESRVQRLLPCLYHLSGRAPLIWYIYLMLMCVCGMAYRFSTAFVNAQWMAAIVRVVYGCRIKMFGHDSFVRIIALCLMAGCFGWSVAFRKQEASYI